MPDNSGTLTLGARHRFSSALSIRGENKIGQGGNAPSILHSFGLDWTPTDHWSFSGSFENGHIDDVRSGRFRRTAFIPDVPQRRGPAAKINLATLLARNRAGV